jgi:hypothetical protein
MYFGCALWLGGSGFPKFEAITTVFPKYGHGNSRAGFSPSSLVELSQFNL